MNDLRERTDTESTLRLTEKGASSPNKMGLELIPVWEPKPSQQTVK